MLKRGNVPLKLSSTCNHLDNYKSHHLFPLKNGVPNSAVEHSLTHLYFFFCFNHIKTAKRLT